MIAVRCKYKDNSKFPSYEDVPSPVAQCVPLAQVVDLVKGIF